MAEVLGITVASLPVETSLHLETLVKLPSARPGQLAVEFDPMQKLSEYVKIAEAARILGASQNTVRSWADQGRIPVTRTPSGYRLFRREDLVSFLKEIAKPFDRRVKPK